MQVMAATRRSVFSRLGGAPSPASACVKKNQVCKYWLSGHCNRNPCRFLHPQHQPKPQASSTLQPKQSSFVWRNPKHQTNKSHNPQQQICKYWIRGDCVRGDNCRNLHAWFYGDGLTMVAKLEGHTKAVTGIALPLAGSDKLYSVSNDKSMRIWDCNSGQCTGVVNFDSECGALISEGPCVCVGLSGAVKVWNFETQSELTLSGAVGKVHAMVVGNDVLFAGLQDGTIFAWKTSSPQAPAVLKGHSGSVLSLVVGANKLYSGSMDKTIKVWDLKSFQCLETLHGHSDVVMDVLCWDSFLISGSLDNQLKVWAANGESGKLEVVYERNEEHGILALCGTYDAEGKPILLCSCNDNSVRLYDLPSFTERGRIFAKREVRTLQISTAGLFFTGDATGQLTVWKLHGTATAVVPP